MRERKRPPQHPGAILKHLYLEPLKISNTKLAETIKVTRKTVSKIVNERGAIIPDMAWRLSKAFGTTPDFWLNLQVKYDLWQAGRESSRWDDISPLYHGGGADASPPSDVPT